MARTDAVFRNSFNGLIKICNKLKVNDKLDPESTLATKLDVSRTVIRSVLQAFVKLNIIKISGRTKTLIRMPNKNDLLTIQERTISLGQLETDFLNWLLHFDVPPNTILNVTKVSKQFSVAPHTLQEFFSGLSRFGLIERRAKGGWILRGFTKNFAIELSDFRVVLEINAIRHLIKLPENHPIWSQLGELKNKHNDLLRNIDQNFHDFSQLDELYHITINKIVKNRFVEEFQKIISLIFHYHYQWDKTEERSRNEAAIKEHIKTIEALLNKDEILAIDCAKKHLNTSKQTLLSSLITHNLG
ncbi:MAG: GntR family transcriptional regulator [Rhizobiales bacterium]|nr:GntR family transcriptional regulator [Hyphomicrobiales bacterium]